MARISFISVAVCCSLLLSGCNSEENNSVPAEELEEIALQVINGGTFQYSEKGNIKNVLAAGKLERWESDGDASEVWRVSGGFALYIDGDKNDHEAKLSGGRGTYDAEKGHLVAYDDVELVNNDKERLRTEYLVWSNDSDRVHTNRPVSIETSTGTLYGKGLEADSKFENYKIIDPTGAFDLQ